MSDVVDLNLPELLRFRPSWVWDPIPPWFFDRLDEGLIVELGRAQLETQHAILKSQLEYTERVMEIVGRAGK